MIPYRFPRRSFDEDGLLGLARCSASLLLLLTGLCGSGLSAFAQQAEPTFSQIIVFGDSLSDTGNIRNRTSERSGGIVDYPSHTFNYSNGRFTNDDDTDPSSTTLRRRVARTARTHFLESPGRDR